MGGCLFALSVSSNEGVPGEAIGLGHLVEHRATVAEVAALGEDGRPEDLGSDEGIAEEACLDGEGVELTDAMEGVGVLEEGD